MEDQSLGPAYQAPCNKNHNYMEVMRNLSLFSVWWLTHGSLGIKFSVENWVQTFYTSRYMLYGVSFVRRSLIGHFEFGIAENRMPASVAARSKAYVCGRPPAGIVGSNPTGGMDVCLLWVCCCPVEVSATSWSLVQRSPTDCGASLCVIQKPREWGGPGPLGAVAPKKQTNKENNV